MLSFDAGEIALINALCAAIFGNEQHRAKDARADLNGMFNDIEKALGWDEVNVYDLGGKRYLKVTKAGGGLEIAVRPRPEPAKPKDAPDDNPDPGQSPPMVETQLALAA